MTLLKNWRGIYKNGEASDCPPEYLRDVSGGLIENGIAKKRYGMEYSPHALPSVASAAAKIFMIPMEIAVGVVNRLYAVFCDSTPTTHTVGNPAITGGTMIVGITDIITNSAVTANGDIISAEIYLETGASGVKVKAFRSNGASWDYVGETEEFICVSGYNNITFTSPISVLIGDHIAIYTNTGQIARVAAGTASYFVGDVIANKAKADWTDLTEKHSLLGTVEESTGNGKIRVTYNKNAFETAGSWTDINKDIGVAIPDVRRAIGHAHIDKKLFLRVESVGIEGETAIAVLRDEMYYIDLTGGEPHSIAAAIDLSSCPHAWDIFEHKNVLFAVGRDFDNRIGRSDQGDPTAGWAHDLTIGATGRGLQIIRGFSFGDRILYLCNKYPVLGSNNESETATDVSYEELDTEAGMEGRFPYAACIGALGAYYLGYDAIYKFDGTRSIDISSATMAKVIQDMLENIGTNQYKVRLYPFYPYIVFQYENPTENRIYYYIFNELTNEWVGDLDFDSGRRAGNSIDRIWAGWSPCKQSSGGYAKYGTYLNAPLYLIGENNVYRYPQYSSGFVYQDKMYDNVGAAELDVDPTFSIQIPSTDEGSPGLDKDFIEMILGFKVTDDDANNLIDALLSINDSAFASAYDADNKFTKQIACAPSGLLEGDRSRATGTRVGMFSYPWILPNTSSYNASGKRVGLKLTCTTDDEVEVKFIEIVSKTTKSEEARLKEMLKKR